MFYKSRSKDSFRFMCLWIELIDEWEIIEEMKERCGMKADWLESIWYIYSIGDGELILGFGIDYWVNLYFFGFYFRIFYFNLY